MYGKTIRMLLSNYNKVAGYKVDLKTISCTSKEEAEFELKTHYYLH